ncbi:MAG: hypothetical protein RL463_1144 [Bacteroidota bacterium]
MLNADVLFIHIHSEILNLLEIIKILHLGHTLAHT